MDGYTTWAVGRVAARSVGEKLVARLKEEEALVRYLLEFTRNNGEIPAGWRREKQRLLGHLDYLEEHRPRPFKFRLNMGDYAWQAFSGTKEKEWRRVREHLDSEVADYLEGGLFSPPEKTPEGFLRSTEGFDPRDDRFDRALARLLEAIIATSSEAQEAAEKIRGVLKGWGEACLVHVNAPPNQPSYLVGTAAATAAATYAGQKAGDAYRRNRAYGESFFQSYYNGAASAAVEAEEAWQAEALARHIAAAGLNPGDYV